MTYKNKFIVRSYFNDTGMEIQEVVEQYFLTYFQYELEKIGIYDE